MASCLTLSCQLECLALKAAGNGGTSVVAGAALMGKPSGFPESAPRLPFSPSCYRFSLRVAKKRWRVYLKTGSGKGTRSAVPPCIRSTLAAGAFYDKSYHILV